MVGRNLDIFQLLHMERRNPELGIGMLAVTSLRMEGWNLKPRTDAIVTESLSTVTSLHASLPMAGQNLEPRTWKAATVLEPLFAVTSLQASLRMTVRNLECKIYVCGHLGKHPYLWQGGT